MGTFSAPISIGSPDRGRWTQVDALVDTGASIASAPASVLRGLGVEPLRKERFTFAQGETREMDVDHAFFERTHITEHRSVAWSDEIELCADALYIRLTCKTAEELMPAAKGLLANA